MELILLSFLLFAVHVDIIINLLFTEKSGNGFVHSSIVSFSPDE